MGISKNGTDEPICRAGKETQRTEAEKRLADPAGGWGVWRKDCLQPLREVWELLCFLSCAVQMN